MKYGVHSVVKTVWMLAEDSGRTEITSTIQCSSILLLEQTSRLCYFIVNLHRQAVQYHQCKFTCSQVTALA